MILNKLNNNKGFGLFITVMTIAAVLTTLAAAYFLKSTDENSSRRREMDSFKAFHAAERGLEYVYAELRNSAPDSKNWFTHVVNAGNGDVLDRQDGASLNVTFSTQNELTGDGYVSRTNQPVQFIAKVYNDPPTAALGREKIIIVRGASGSEQRILAARVVMGSLYEYFMFSPNSGYSFQGTWDARGGKIHANGNITFYGNAKVLNVTQLSTAGYFQYGRGTNMPPLIDTTATPAIPGVTSMKVNNDTDKRTLAQLNMTGQPPTSGPTPTWAEILGVSQTNWAQGACGGMSNQADCLFDANVSAPLKYYNNDKFLYSQGSFNGYLAGDHWGTLCKNASGQYQNCGDVYGVAGWTLVDPLLYPTPYMYMNPDGSGGLVAPAKVSANGGSQIPIPNRLNTEWRWPKYELTDANQGSGNGNGRSYLGITYSYPPKYPFPGSYDPNNIDGTCNDNLCPRVKFLNTKYQVIDWQVFLANQNGGVLDGIMMDANTGATTISAPTVNAQIYRDMASSKCFYIKNTIAPATFNSYVVNNINTHYRDPTKTLENNGNYQVIVKGDTANPLVPDAQGQIIVNVPGEGNLVLFEKVGFYNHRSSQWAQSVTMNVGNIKKAIDAAAINSCDTNITYSDWPLGLANAVKMPTGGMTFVTEGEAYAYGDINTLEYQPASVITPYKFWPLSSNFNFPQTVPELGNHPDRTFIPFADQMTQDNIWRQNHQSSLPDKRLQDHVYNISIVGDSAAAQNSLQWDTSTELDTWKNDWLNAGEPYKAYRKTLTGTLLRLPPGSFVPTYNYGYGDGNVFRQCTQAECAAGAPTGPYEHVGTNNVTYQWPSCGGCSAYCTAANNYCSGQQPALLPVVPDQGNGTLFQWESRYLNGTLPPGDLAGLNFAGWILLDNAPDSFDKQCKALQGNP